jgi:hypothetical protein
MATNVVSPISRSFVFKDGKWRESSGSKVQGGRISAHDLWQRLRDRPFILATFCMPIIGSNPASCRPLLLLYCYSAVQALHSSHCNRRKRARGTKET